MEAERNYYGLSILEIFLLGVEGMLTELFLGPLTMPKTDIAGSYFRKFIQKRVLIAVRVKYRPKRQSI